MANKTLNVYNLTKIGVDVDTDNLHVPVGGWRQAQNFHPSPILEQAESIITRKGIRSLNAIAMGTGPVLGGVTIPAFESGDGEPTLLLGFGD